MEYNHGFGNPLPLITAKWPRDGLWKVLLGSLPIPLEEELLLAGQLGNASLLQSNQTTCRPGNIAEAWILSGNFTVRAQGLVPSELT